jgi:hypothetical protein
VYQPFHFPPHGQDEPYLKDLRFKKLTHPRISSGEDSDTLSQLSYKLEAYADVGGYSAVLIHDKTPRIVLKEASSLPKVLDWQHSEVKSVASFHAARCKHGLVWIDQAVRITVRDNKNDHY